MVRSFYPVSMIHGPPGTGKTRTLCAIVVDAFKRKQGVICLGWTNVCVRKLCESLKEVLPSRAVGILTAREYRIWHESEYAEFSEVEVDDCNRQVICMTVCNYLFRMMHCDTCNQWAYSDSNPKLVKHREVAVLDEASQVCEMIGGIVLSCFGGYSRTSVVGDDRQLPPYVAKELDNVASILTWVRKLKQKFATPITLL